MKKKVALIILGVVFICNSCFIFCCGKRISYIFQIRKHVEHRIVMISLRRAALRQDILNKDSIQLEVVTETVDLAKNIRNIPRLPRQEKLPLRLLGIMRGKDSVAFIELIDQQMSGIYRPGDRIGNIVISGILDNCVLLNVSGQEKALIFEPIQTRSKKTTLPLKFISDNEIIIRKNEFCKRIIDVANEANELRVNKEVNSETKHVEGLKVRDIPQNGLIQDMGLKNEDIIKSINGEKVTSVPGALLIANKVKTAPIIELGIIRNGISMVLNYHFKD